MNARFASEAVSQMTLTRWVLEHSIAPLCRFLPQDDASY